MQFINLSIFLAVSAIVIAVLKPKSKTQVWLFSIFIPIVFSFLYGYGAIIISGSKLSIAYQLGGSIGGSIPSIIVSIIVLLVCLNKKSKAKEDYNFPKLLIVFIVISALIGGCMLYAKNKSTKMAERYYEDIMNNDSVNSEDKAQSEMGYFDRLLLSEESHANTDDTSYSEKRLSSERYCDSENDNNPTTDMRKMFHDEMVSEAQSYNKELPENIGYGMTMVRCAIENHSMVYTIRWDGLDPSVFSPEDIAELKAEYIEGLVEVCANVMMKNLLYRMNNYGYNFVYRLINENGEKLCSIKIQPSEILQ